MKKEKIYKILYYLLGLVLVGAGLVMVANADFTLGPIILACGIILLIKIIRDKKSHK